MSELELLHQTWLVTGAAGRIGVGLADHLGPRVGSLVLADRDAPTVTHDNQTVATIDLTDPDTLHAAVRGVDGVIHLAGIADEAPYRDLITVNALGTYHLLEAMRAAGVSRLVYASSNRVTGFQPGTSTLDADGVVRPDSLYGASKAAAEALTRLYSDKFGFTVVNLRIGSFKLRPTTPRDAATWLSHGDAWRAFDAAMTTSVPFACFYGVSANTHRFWSLEPGRECGYEPQDDAAQWLGPDVAPDPAGPQSGHLASAQYTLDHM